MTAPEANSVHSQKLPQELPSKPVILLAVGSLVVAIIIYFVKFALIGLSTQETWGQFGDFVGGLVNPLIGLCTIWLLVGSLKQNHMALLQAHQDLETTRKILEETQNTQKTTEESLRKQIEISDQTRDINNALTILNKLTADLEGVKSRAGVMSNRQDVINLLNKRIYQLNEILDQETSRLINKYEVTK